MSTAFDPSQGLFYLMALEKCSIFTKSSALWKAGESYYGGGAREVPGERQTGCGVASERQSGCGDAAAQRSGA